MGEGRLALVTGANRGVGYEICRQLAQRGLSVLLTGRREKAGRTACEELAADGLAVHFLPLDVTSPESVAAAFERIERDFGRLDALVNNAGISVEKKTPAVEVDMDTVQRVLDTNLIGAWRLCQAAAPLMRRGGYGRIVNVSSGVGSFSKLAGGFGAYRISKTGLNALTRILADELRDDNVLVNAMTPGWVRTHMGGIQAPRSVEEGAETAVWLATLPDDGPTGKFFRDREEFPW
jgi:NAD(P)-dependent dehydrogenase (short-subunit alcohol dehydrogenase family)